MKRTVPIIILFIIVFCSCSWASASSVYDLQCEKLTDPLAVDVTTPHFSWKIGSGLNGTEQKAYQILVASDLSLLEEGKADLWDSEKIESSASVMVPYKGKELQSRTHAYWKVKIWDNKSRKPVWSDAAFFGVGLLDPDDWSASYIGFPSNAGNPDCPLIRKQFSIDKIADKAYLHVNSLGYHEVYVNGSKVGDDVLSPCVAQLNERSLIVTYDLSSYLREGKNDLVIWLARGWYQPGLPGVVYDGPLVRAQLEMLDNREWSTVIASDHTWQCRESGRTGIGNWKPWGFGGESVDAGKIPDDFKTETLNALTWHSAANVKVPDHTVSPMMSEPNRIMETIQAIEITSFKDSLWLVDMGKALTGWFEIKFPALKARQEIVMEYGDHLDNNGNIVSQGHRDRYIASGKENEVFRTKFNYHGFQYVQISGLDIKPEIKDVKAYLIHTNCREASSFECSDSDMNAIHDLVQYSLKCLSLGGYIVDCPHIERLGYGGDGNASILTAQTMFDLSPLYANWIQTWADCIREDGGMPHTAPNPYSAGGGPYWCGFIIPASWHTYVNYGDSRLIEKYYPVMQHWFEYVDKYTVDGLLKKWPDLGYRGWYLGDWVPPHGTNPTDQQSIDIVNNCFIVECYAMMEKIAAVLGKVEDAAQYAKLKDQLRERIHECYFDSTTNSYASGSQIDLAYPLLAQVTPAALVPAVSETLYNLTEVGKKGHLAVGLVGVSVLTELLTKNYSTELMYRMLKKREYPGYLYMIDNGATTTWEEWSGERSRIHNCYNGIGSWFYQAVGGIRPDENSPGYQKVIIAPQIPSGITWAKTSKETPYGLLNVEWKIEKDILYLELTIPVGCTALLELPQGVNEYKLNGKTRKSHKNEIPSGKHKISYDMN